VSAPSLFLRFGADLANPRKGNNVLAEMKKKPRPESRDWVGRGFKGPKRLGGPCTAMGNATYHRSRYRGCHGAVSHDFHSYSATTNATIFLYRALQCSIERLRNRNLTNATSAHAPRHSRRIVCPGASRPLFIRREIRRHRRSDGAFPRSFCNRIARAMGVGAADTYRRRADDF
jgi:hypothetical protein